MEYQLIDKACRIALLTQKYSYRTVEQILLKGIDFNYKELFDEQQDDQSSHIPNHENIRGNAYS